MERGLLSLVLLAVLLGVSHPGWAECPSADLTGDCRVDLNDFAVMAGQWLQEGSYDYAELSHDLISTMESRLSTSAIDASGDNAFILGTYFIYKTNEGRFGRFMVENYEPDANHRLTIQWTTYNADGSVYSEGYGLEIRGTYGCDLDEGLELATFPGRDWYWNLQTHTSRALAPAFGARFDLLHQALGLKWAYINDPGVPRHEGFTGYMSKYEITNGQYCEFLNSAMEHDRITVYQGVVYASNDENYEERYFYIHDLFSSSQISYSEGKFSVISREGVSMDRHPVVMVTWYGANAFCDYYGYRLPTEWEWQAVADGIDGTNIYGCGMTIDTTKANYDDANPLGLSSYPYTSPVGYYPAYDYGMYDMAGNVYEWTSSPYEPSEEIDYVVRGGAWWETAPYCTVTVRDNRAPDGANDDRGFRVCR